MYDFQLPLDLSPFGKSFARILDSSLAPVYEREVLSPSAQEAVSRGSFCLIIASVEAYFTKVGIRFAILCFSSLGGEEFDRFCNSFQDLSKAAGVKLPVNVGSMDSTEMENKISIVLSRLTFNVKSRINMLGNLLFDDVGFDIWSECYKHISTEIDIETTWDLSINRRNEIMHQGDLDQHGLRFRPFSFEYTLQVSKIASAMVCAFEEKLTQRFDS